MTREDIIRIADASGLSYYGMGKDRERFIAHLQRFAAFVAAAEREACAKVCEVGQMNSWGCAKEIRARGQA